MIFTGNSGVSKTILAKLTHSKSTRKNGPMIEINCGVIPENLVESELFGYEKVLLQVPVKKVNPD